LHQLNCISAGGFVVNVLALAPRFDKSFLSKYGELLGKGWLMDVEESFKFTDIPLTLNELAKDEESVLICQNLEKIASRRG
jgi:hypothetical protein